MSEIEWVTEILIGSSALGVIVLIMWQYRTIKRQIVEEQDRESGEKESSKRS